jgi:hypothetical protein
MRSYAPENTSCGIPSGLEQVLSTHVLLKGLKDKGDARQSVKALRHDLETVQRAMKAARIDTRSIPSHVFFLEIYRRSTTNQITLRWRKTDTRHTTWDKVLPVVRTYPSTMRSWYEAMNEHAALLNLKSSFLVTTIRMLERFQEPGGPERGIPQRGPTEHRAIRQQMLALVDGNADGFGTDVGNG